MKFKKCWTTSETFNMDLAALNQTAVFYALGWTIAHSLWQMGLLWLIYQLVFGLYKNIKPGIRYSASALFLFAGFFWFVLTFISQFNTYQSINRYIRNLPEPITNNLTAVGINGDPSAFLSGAFIFRVIETFIPYLSVAYLFIITFLFIRLINAYVYTQKIRTSGLISAGEALERRLGDFLRKLSMNRSVKIYLSELINVPATVGFFKPVILLPVAAINHLTPEQAESIILHELAHIRRQDYLLNLLVSVMETILFFNPFAHLFSVSLKKDRELHCDDFVMAFNRDPKNYATALLSLEKMRLGSAPALALAATGEDGLLLKRVKRILNVQNQNFRYGEKLIALVVISGLLSALAWLDPVPVEKQYAKETNISGAGSTHTEPEKKETLTLSDLVKQTNYEPATRVTEKRTAKGERNIKNSSKNTQAGIGSLIPVNTTSVAEYPGEITFSGRKSGMASQGTLTTVNGSRPHGPNTEEASGNLRFMNIPEYWQGALAPLSLFIQQGEAINNKENFEKFVEAFRNYSFANEDGLWSEKVLPLEQLEKLRLFFHGQNYRRLQRNPDTDQIKREQSRNRKAARSYIRTTQPAFEFFNDNDTGLTKADSISGSGIIHFSPESVYQFRNSVTVPGVRRVKRGQAVNSQEAAEAPVSPLPDTDTHSSKVNKTYHIAKTFKNILITAENKTISEFSPEMSNPVISKEFFTYTQPVPAKTTVSKKRKPQSADRPEVHKKAERDSFLIMIETENDIIHIRLENH